MSSHTKSDFKVFEYLGLGAIAYFLTVTFFTVVALVAAGLLLAAFVVAM